MRCKAGLISWNATREQIIIELHENAQNYPLSFPVDQVFYCFMGQEAISFDLLSTSCNKINIRTHFDIRACLENIVAFCTFTRNVGISGQRTWSFFKAIIIVD